MGRHGANGNGGSKRPKGVVSLRRAQTLELPEFWHPVLAKPTACTPADEVELWLSMYAWADRHFRHPIPSDLRVGTGEVLDHRWMLPAFATAATVFPDALWSHTGAILDTVTRQLRSQEDRPRRSPLRRC